MGVFVEGGRFQLICGLPVVRPRYLDEGAVSALETFSKRYDALLGSASRLPTMPPAAGQEKLSEEELARARLPVALPAGVARRSGTLAVATLTRAGTAAGRSVHR